MAIAWTPQFASGQDLAFGVNTATFSGLTLGIGDILLCVYVTSSPQAGPTSVTVAGNSATQLSINATGAAGQHSVWFLQNNASATGSIVITCPNAIAIIGISGGLLTGEDPTTATSSVTVEPSQGDPQTCSATIPSNGISIIFINGASGGSSDGIPTTWSNATRDAALEWKVTTNNTGAGAGAHITVGGTVTVGATGSAGNGWGFATTMMSVTSFSPIAPSILMGAQVW